MPLFYKEKCHPEMALLILLTFFFFDEAVLISQHKFVDIVDFFLDFLAVIGIGGGGMEVLQFDGVGYGFNILIGFEGFTEVGTGLMLEQTQTAGVGNQGIACDACFAVISATEAAVDDQNFTVGLNRAFAFFYLNRYVTVDDTAAFFLEAEFP